MCQRWIASKRVAWPLSEMRTAFGARGTLAYSVVTSIVET